MAQVKFQGNLSAASFPFASAFKGPSVVIPGRDQSSGPYRDFSGATSQLGMNLPQMYYAENIVPTNEGYKSVSYNDLIAAASGFTGEWSEIYPVFDGETNRALIGITTTYEVWILSVYTSGVWTKLTIPGGPWTSGWATNGTVFGVVYLNLQGLGVFSVDIPNTLLVKETVTGADDTLFIGICDAVSYLIAWDRNSVINSSSLNPLDFVPSTITGAGGGTPEGLQGQIVFCKKISQGFIVYTSALTIAGIYQGNSSYPFFYKPLANGAGISSPSDVSADSDLNTHLAWTTAGLLEVSIQYCVVKYPDLTDFLAAGIYEYWDSEQNIVVTNKTEVPYRIRIASVASRYILVSYGLAGPSVQNRFSVLYDSVLKRYGKLAVPHSQLFELVSDTGADGLTWEESAPNEWEDYPVSWSSLVEFSNTTPKAKNTIGVLGIDGSISYVNFSYATNDGDGIIVLGKFQLTRTSLCTLEEITVETSGESGANFSAHIWTTLDGKNVITPVVNPYNYAHNDGYRRFNCRVTGENHSVVFKGGFNLTSYVMAMHQSGRR